MPSDDRDAPREGERTEIRCPYCHGVLPRAFGCGCGSPLNLLNRGAYMPRHTHVGPNERCARCDLNIRDSIHLRANESHA